MAFRVVIPARFGSTRLPGKPLVPIGGKPLIQHVHERARRSAAAEVVVATDDPRIAAVVRGFGGRACMTGAHHHSGTDRVAEVLDALAWPDDTCVVNLQGDEPCMPPALVDQVAGDLERYPAAMATLAGPIRDREALFDPHVVKVVTDAAGFALYFSRAPIPWHRDGPPRGEGPPTGDVEPLRHIGLYAYRAGFLRRFVGWAPAPLERAEALEQLRVLWRGERIHVSLAAVEPGPGVDTPEDVARVEARMRAGGCP
jgi:3-deoxy-manno-octulosonate cytidylyltransferase (CMP-KDO synthetase)